MSFLDHTGYQNLELFYGDLHNHCGLSYGHGSFEDAVKNAQLQLDFASVTLHAAWPDIPTEDKRLDYLVNYHKLGFAKALENWSNYLQQVEDNNENGKFVMFPSYEWHSNQYGDHCIYYKQGVDQPILEVPDLRSLRNALHQLPTESFLIPHHIGYKQGFRGINWSTFSQELSPVVETFSFHGSSESSVGPYPYLHTMGPRHEQSCAQYGWSQGNIFGVIGSTDHHNAFPGSYGSGRLGVWSESLTRDAVWQAIKKRHTYTLTGDRIELLFSLNGCMMGDNCPSNDERQITVDVLGGDTIDYIEVLHNNRIIHRECPPPPKNEGDHFKVYLELGWGEEPKDTLWDMDFQVSNGKICGVEPRFRGFASQGEPEGNNYAYTHWEQHSPSHVHFNTKTRPNPSLHTAATEGMSFEIQGDRNTQIVFSVNEHQYRHPLSDIFHGSRTHYLSGFVSPAICLHRAVPQSEYQHHFTFSHHHQASQRDWYYVRVRQRNNQWAWSSPIWLEKPKR